jgi:hypothetical protein
MTSTTGMAVENVSSAMVASLNRVLEEALAINFGLEVGSVNPFKYFSRLSRHDYADGAYSVHLDGVEILWVGQFEAVFDYPVPESFRNASIGMKFKYRITDVGPFVR